MKLYARMLEARCPLDPAGMEKMLPVLEDEIVPYVLREPGCRQMHFFVDQEAGTVFSISIFETEEDLRRAMEVGGSDFRFRTLAGIGCTAVSARALTVVAGGQSDAAARS